MTLDGAQQRASRPRGDRGRVQGSLPGGASRRQAADPLGRIISVLDTHQKSVLPALDKERSLRVLTCSTEDDANAVAAGLYVTASRGRDDPARGSLREREHHTEPSFHQGLFVSCEHL